MNYAPYTYLIGWSSYNRYYYGIEFKNSKLGIANPANLWTTYFTSSKTVQHLRLKYGEPDIVQVRKVFHNRETAIKWEQKVLRRMKVLQNDKWINCNIGGAVVLSAETRKLIAEKNRGMIKHSPEDRLKRSIETRERNLARGGHSEDTKRKISKAQKGKKKHKDGSRLGKLNPMWGRRKLADGTWIKLP